MIFIFHRQQIIIKLFLLLFRTTEILTRDTTAAAAAARAEMVDIALSSNTHSWLTDWTVALLRSVARLVQCER